MVIRQPSLEEALIQKINDGDGSVFELMMLVQECNSSFGEIDKILTKYIKNNTVVKIGYKFEIKK